VAALGLLIAAVPTPAGVDPRAWRLLAIFVATVVGIVAKPLPIPAMALVGIAAALATRTLTLAEALSGFSNATVWLVVSAFFIAAGFIRTGLGARIAYLLVMVFGRSTLGLGYSLVAADFVLAPLVPSNTARAAGVVFPILQSLAGVTAGSGSRPDREARTFLTLTAYNGTVITSAMFLTGMVGNPLVVQLAAEQGITITWRLWALAAALPGLVSLIIVPMVIYAASVSRKPAVTAVPASLGARSARDIKGEPLVGSPAESALPAVARPGAPEAARAALADLGPVKTSERLMAVVSIALVAAWIAGPTFGIDTTAASLVAIAVLLVTGVLTWDDLASDREAWNTFVWFAVLVTMASYLGQLGLIGWFTGMARSVFGGVGWTGGFLSVVLVYFFTHYFFASNTAHVSAMYAPFLSVLLAIGTPPLPAALILGFCSSLFASLTHYGTGPAPVLFSSGHVTLATWWRIGLIVSLVNLAIWLVVGGVWWRVIGLW
jgi:DASS family divalent anion:Na+ symporter